MATRYVTFGVASAASATPEFGQSLSDDWVNPSGALANDSSSASVTANNVDPYFAHPFKSGVLTLSAPDLSGLVPGEIIVKAKMEYTAWSITAAFVYSPSIAVGGSLYYFPGGAAFYMPSTSGVNSTLDVGLPSLDVNKFQGATVAFEVRHFSVTAGYSATTYVQFVRLILTTAPFPAIGQIV